MVSPILCPIHEDTPGPAMPDLSGLAEGRLQLPGDRRPHGPRRRLTLTHDPRRARAARAPSARRDDPHLHYLDGRELYGEEDAAELPLPDELHPDAATHRRIGERFAERVFGDGGPFADGS